MPTSQIFVLPPPVGGINLRDIETQFPQGGGVPITDALELKNIFPGTQAADVRGGTEEYVDLSSLAGWSGGSTETLATLIRGTNSYFVAASEGGFADISTSTASEITAAGTFTSDRWAWISFLDDGTVGGFPELLLVNGEDNPQRFDGTTMSTWNFQYDASSPTAFSDITAFIGMVAFKNRVFMWQEDSPDFWYGQLGKIPGTTGGGTPDVMERFPLSAVRGIQGNIIAMEAWTRDAGDGADDYLAIIMSGGVVAVYKGTDPGDATAWAIDGVYQIPPPVDRRGVSKFLDDIVILTESDVVFLSQVIRNQGIVGAESKVAPLIKRLVSQYGNTTGWEITLFPKATRAYVNVPYSTSTAQQVVFNTRSLAACEYTGWNARTFGVFEGNVYFGDASGIVWLAETGARDNEGEIITLWRTPLMTLGKAGAKRITAVRPDLTVSDPVNPAFSISVDFVTNAPSATVSVGDSVGWIWDTSPSSGPTWDDLKWSGLNDRTAQTSWCLVSGAGEKMSIAMEMHLDDIAVTINSLGIQWIPMAGRF